MAPPLPFFAEFFHPSETYLFSAIYFRAWHLLPPNGGWEAVKNFAPASHPIWVDEKEKPLLFGCDFLEIRIPWDSSPFFTTNLGIPSSKLTWQWKFTFSNRKYIFKWWIFHCHVRLPEGNIFGVIFSSHLKVRKSKVSFRECKYSLGRLPARRPPHVGTVVL